jgi:DNA polymerase I-like protein with 3'-5' exonuclease and polymerase domains
MVTSEKESLDLKLIMENAIPLKVPVIADIDLGPTWC